MTHEPMLLTIGQGRADIVLNRPERLNALTRHLMEDLGAAITSVAAQDAIRVVTISGAGRGFCAGQDLSERDPRKLHGPLDLAGIQRELFHPVIRGIQDMGKPVIARVNGIAAGAGAALALACDIVLADENAKFAMSFAKVGLSVDAGLGKALVQGLGPARAKALLMLGETLDAKAAAAVGLIWKAVPADALDDSFETLVAQLRATPRASLSGIKRALADSYLHPDIYFATEAERQGIAGKSPDYAEGVLAFLEKRSPNYS